MLTNPDPATVREIAQEVANIALHDAVHVDQWISAVVNSRFGNECSSFRAPLHTAVARRMAVVKPSWPDELPQDGAAPDLWWPFTGGADTCYLSHDDDGGYRECCMRAGLAYVLKLHEQQVRASATDERAVAEAVARLKRWLNGRQDKVHSVVSTTNVIAEPRDRSTAAWAIAESDARDTKPEA